MSVTGEVAREVWERQGNKAMLAGSIASLGSHYVLALDAVNCRTGESLAREQVEATSREQVLTTLGKAASEMLGQPGESLGSIQKFDVPLTQATTSSPEALKAYTEGRDQGLRGNDAAAIPFFRRARELRYATRRRDFHLVFHCISLLVNGLLILGSGIYELLHPPGVQVVLFHLHASIWWGALLTVIEAVYCLKFSPSAPEQR